MTNKEKENLIRGVYDIVKTIPHGRACSYGAIAKAAGYPNMSRMIGKIMGQCPADCNIPTHRVVNSQGILSGKEAFGNSDEMKLLLEAEGIKIHNNRICNWKAIFWNPIEEIFFE